MTSKRCATLIEVLIALALVSILLAGLLGIYRQTVGTQRRIEASLQRNFQLLYAQFRLGQVIPMILNPADDKKNKGIVFYTQTPKSLVFAFDNGTGSGELFSNEVLARLFVDDNQQLILLTWPILSRYPNIEPPMRTEVLLNNVTDLKFAFFTPRSSDEQGQQIVANASEPSTWPIDEEGIPSILRMFVTIDGQGEVKYAFVLPNTTTPVKYP